MKEQKSQIPQGITEVAEQMANEGISASSFYGTDIPSPEELRFQIVMVEHRLELFKAQLCVLLKLNREDFS